MFYYIIWLPCTALGTYSPKLSERSNEPFAWLGSFFWMSMKSVLSHFSKKIESLSYKSSCRTAVLRVNTVSSWANVSQKSEGTPTSLHNG